MSSYGCKEFRLVDFKSTRIIFSQNVMTILIKFVIKIRVHSKLLLSLLFSHSKDQTL
jgi:hypothetical protein